MSDPSEVKRIIEELFKLGRCSHTYKVKHDLYGRVTKQCFMPAEITVGDEAYCRVHAVRYRAAMGNPEPQQDAAESGRSWRDDPSML